MSADPHHRFQVRCDSGMHRVALDPERYWRPAKCPSCRTRMDRRRLRRMRHWLLGTAPRSAVRIGDRLRLVPMDMLALLFLALMLTVTLLLHTVADEWWPATVMLFLGRWPWLLPGVPVLLLALMLPHRRALGTTLLAALVGFFGILKFSPGIGRLTAGTGTATQVRVITFNIAGSMVAPMSLVSLTTEWQPDIVALQECGATSIELLRGVPTYQSDTGATCLFTRFPIVRIDSLPPAAGADSLAHAHWVKRYRLKGPDGEFDFTNVNLNMRRPLGAELPDDARHPAIEAADLVDVRARESQRTQQWVTSGPGPHLVAGDFDMPTESAIYRRHWGSMANGFARAGFGFGDSRRTSWIHLRVDHVLADDAWVVQSARVLPSYGSYHLPVMVDVALRAR